MMTCLALFNDSTVMKIIVKRKKNANFGVSFDRFEGFRQIHMCNLNKVFLRSNQLKRLHGRSDAPFIGYHIMSCQVELRAS